MSNEFRSDLALFHATNPDPFHDGCPVSGNIEPGVIYPQIDVVDADYCFIGKTALTEAIAMVFELTPGQVIDRLTREKSQVANLQATVADQKEHLEAHRELIAKMREVVAAEDAV